MKEARDQPSILVVDDTRANIGFLLETLSEAGYRVRVAPDGETALEQVQYSPPDLVLLDVMMPKMDGFTVCRRVREFSQVPIIIVTARGQDQDKVKGLDLGADDYLTKPFSVEELLARVRAVLRRTQYNADDAGAGRAATATIGDMTIDYAQHLVQLAGREILLTPTEYRLLAYLAQNVGRVLTQDLLLEHVWGGDYLGESHMLQVNINRLRHKLEADPAHPRYLKTKVGIGYMLVAPSD
jgi:DNA-binding response OmpR family regulator